jgi:pimeloyl-ACP methyl ester carboxylesterase
MNLPSTVAEKFRPPSESLYLTEPLRAMFELGALHLSEPWLNLLRGGDGHPVMVIPGFSAGGRSTKTLRDFLASLGYSVSCWNQGINFGVREELVVGAIEVLHQLHEEYGCKVSLVGQSLGGIYAREIAKLYPDMVRQVISLGSPFNDPEGSASKVSGLYKLFNPEHTQKAEQFEDLDWNPHVAPPTPTTAIFSKGDGICHWRSCVQHGGHEHVENVEVISSHTGMGVNAQVMFVVADRLALSEDRWRPFHVSSYFGFPPPGDFAA